MRTAAASRVPERLRWALLGCLTLLAACDTDYPRYRADTSRCARLVWVWNGVDYARLVNARVAHPTRRDLCVGMFWQPWGHFVKGRVLDARVDDRPVDFHTFMSEDVPLRLPHVAANLEAGRHAVWARVGGLFTWSEDACSRFRCGGGEYEAVQEEYAIVDAGWPLRFDDAILRSVAVPGHAQVALEVTHGTFEIYDLESGDVLTSAPTSVTVPTAYGIALQIDDRTIDWWNGAEWIQRTIPEGAAALSLDGQGRVLGRRDGALWIGNDRLVEMSVVEGTTSYPLKSGWILAMPRSDRSQWVDLFELSPEGATFSTGLGVSPADLEDDLIDVHGWWYHWTMTLPLTYGTSRIYRRTADGPADYSYDDMAMEPATACRSAEWRLVNVSDRSSWRWRRLQVRRSDPTAGWRAGEIVGDRPGPEHACLPGFGWVYHQGPHWADENQRHTYWFVPLGHVSGEPPVTIEPVAATD